VKRALLVIACSIACKSSKREAVVENKPPAPAQDASVVPTVEECDQLLGHLVDLELAEASAAATTDAMKQELVQRRTTVIDNQRDEFQRGCRILSRERLLCALAAEDQAAMDKCDDSKP
jgi:hypothetical protein